VLRAGLGPVKWGVTPPRSGSVHLASRNTSGWRYSLVGASTKAQKAEGTHHHFDGRPRELTPNLAGLPVIGLVSGLHVADEDWGEIKPVGFGLADP
jgi:hypothetical protein